MKDDIFISDKLKFHIKKIPKMFLILLTPTSVPFSVSVILCTIARIRMVVEEEIFLLSS